MNSQLLEIAAVFGWSTTLVQYYKSLIKDDRPNIDAVVLSYFVDLYDKADEYDNMNQQYIIVDIDGHIAHESILSLAKYWARIKSRLDNDTVFMDAFKSKINKYQFCTLC